MPSPSMCCDCDCFTFNSDCICDNCKEDIETHIDYHRCKAKDDSCIDGADCPDMPCPDEVNRCDCECNDECE